MLKGTFTALITPFKSDLSIDEEAFRKLIQFQIENGISGILPLGTTGEAPTITDEETKRVLEIAVNEANGKIPVLAGTSSNCTKKTVKTTKMAKEVGADYALVCTPYYNKPTQKGIRLHFETVADVGLPVIVYNIKGRCGVNIETDTLMELAKHPNIVAVKEASGNLDQMKDVIARAPEGFNILCGDDGMTLNLIKAGGNGVISVASNIAPTQVGTMVNHALSGNLETAEKENEELTELFKTLFIETNPIPVKTAWHLMGNCEEVFRLPMCTMEDKTKAILVETLKKYQLIK